MITTMRVRPRWIGLVTVMAAARIAVAEPPATEKPKQPARTAQSAAEPAGRTTSDRKALWRQLREEREKTVRERGEIFARIAVKHDYSGEYVLFRDQDVTAFLDLKDPKHTRYSPAPEHDDDGAAGSSKRLAHVLVVPNQPRETIGKTLGSDISAEDLQLTLKVMREASALAARLGINNPKIYVKSPERVGVGYLHVHIVGERDPEVSYPPPLR